MIIHSVTIRHFGSVKDFSRDFTDGINVIKNRAARELAYGLGILLNQKAVSPLSFCEARADTELTARVSVCGKTYALRAACDGPHAPLRLQVWDGRGENATAEYEYLTAHCAEQDRADFFDGDEKGYRMHFALYVSDEYGLSPRELSRRTEGLSQIKTFRAYLAQFVKDFRPEILRDGKPYELVLRRDGCFGVQNPKALKERVFLSESEERMFDYLCFLRTAEFWRGFEEIRNLHSVKKPLIIMNFLERLDESVDTRELMQRASRLERQLLICTM